MESSPPASLQEPDVEHPSVKGNAAPTGRRFPEWLFLVLLIGALVAVYALVPPVREGVHEGLAVVRSGDEQRMQDWAASFGAWGPVTLLALQLVQTVLAVIPALPLMIVAVLGYGPLWGGLLAWSGLLLACAFGYWIGRTFGAVALDRFVSKDVEAKVRRFVDRYGVWAIIVTRFSPLFPADAVSFVAGVTRFGFPRYLLATAIGILPMSLLLAFLGADVKRLMGGLLVTSLLTLTVFVVYVVRDGRREAARLAMTERHNES